MEKLYIEVNVTNILYNLDLLIKNTNKNIFAVVKSNAYGLGAVEISKLIEDKVTYLCVGTENEGIQLRQSGIEKPILILSPYFTVDKVISYQLTPTVDNVFHLEQLHKKVSELNIVGFPFHLKINTGMNRFGLQVNSLEEFLDIYQTHSSCLHLEGVFSHFATTMKKPHFVEKQLSLFEECLSVIQKRGFSPLYLHMANSKLTLDNAKTHFNSVRVGNALYGHILSDEDWGFRRTFKVKCPIIDIRNVLEGEYIGYGAHVKAKKPTVVGILPFGLYDGFLSTRQPNLNSLKDLLKEILSRVKSYFIPNPVISFYGNEIRSIGLPNMQFTIVDLTDIKNIQVADELEIKIPIFSIKESVPRKYVLE